MFYEVLMEKRAQQGQQDEQKPKPKLSLGQKAGIVGAGVVGGLAGPVAISKNKRIGDYLWHGSKEERQTKDKLRAMSGKIRDLVHSAVHDNLDISGSTLIPDNVKQLASEYQALAYPKERLELGTEAYSQMLDNRLAKAEKLKAAREALQGEADAKSKEFNEGLRKRLARRNSLVYGGAMLGGGLALGYGAKKLFDRHNRRKQREE